MSITALELVEYGQRLCGGVGEHEWRAAIGRSYYGAYHAAKSWHDSLPSPGSSAAGAGAHETLIRCLTNPTVADSKTKLTSKSIGYVLRHHKVLRVEADYDLGALADVAKAHTAVEYARQLMSKATSAA